MFVAHMRTLMGAENYEALGKARQKELLETNWETGIKRNYDGSDKYWTVTIPSIGHRLLHDPKKGIDHGRTILKG